MDRMTFVTVNMDGSQTRIAFDPLDRPEVYGGKALYDLYVGDCDDHPRAAWIEDPDGFYAYRNRHVG